MEPDTITGVTRSHVSTNLYAPIRLDISTAEISESDIKFREEGESVGVESYGYVYFDSQYVQLRSR